MTLILQFKFALALVVIKSLEPLETPDPIWGLQLIPESVENRNISFIEGVTFCGRFYYHRFPSYPLTLVKMGPQVFFYVLTLFLKAKLCNQVRSLSLFRWRTLTLLKI